MSSRTPAERKDGDTQGARCGGRTGGGVTLPAASAAAYFSGEWSKGGQMSKFAKGKSWIEHRLDSDLAVDDRHYTVNLLARKGTGVQGFRVTVVYLPHDGSDTVERDLPNAASTADVHRITRELTGDRARLAALCREPQAT
jgi:hypothetical protein